MSRITAFVIIILYILFADIVWLTIQKPRYNNLVKNVQGYDISVRIGPAIFTYILVIISIIFIVIPLAESKKKNKNLLTTSLIYGGGTGLCVYGIFNFTNLSIFKEYGIQMATVDTLWGVFLYTTSCYLFLIMT